MDKFVGVWGSEHILGPELRGQIRVERIGAQWHASIATLESSAALNDGILSFDFADNLGEFRGHYLDDNSNIAGHWIQPGGITNGDSYATPLTLSPNESEGGVWTGEIVPLDDRIEVYLVIEQLADGTATAFLRDREANAGLWLRIEKVQFEGDDLHLISTTYGEITGKYDLQGDTLSIALPLYPLTLEFTRRNRDTAPGFYPRTPGTSHYAYQQPSTEHDGWRTGSLADVGIDRERIAALVEQILRTETTGVRTPYIHSLLIARHGLLVLEEYFYGYNRDQSHDMRSATKSMATALVGVALDKGAPFNVTTQVQALFPEYEAYENDDPQKRAITVENLLTMTSGLACDDNDDDSPGNEDTMQSQDVQHDWYKYMLDLPMVSEPGGGAVYCSGGINLLGGVLRNTISDWLPDFFCKYFAQPLDFGRYHLLLTPSPGKTLYMGGGSRLRPRDLMKLGQIFLSGGVWNGKQVISKEWVERSTQPHSHFEDHDYGYGWHLGQYEVAGESYPNIVAGGNGGQFVIIVPRLDMVVMFTAGNYGNYPIWSKFRDELVPEFIIPAATATP